ncbi:MAG TPA: tetratricopeptide repeat protein [Gemmataceae bacterium]|jgi:tetratricopeptide (TPR) repeat protein|nr:tetratricopeptide repeat protein [Gemmataceae bacterium]
MNERISRRRLQLLLQHANDSQTALLEIARRFETGGVIGTEAIRRLRSVLAPQVRRLLHALAAQVVVGTEVSEIGAGLLCTAVRISEFVFSRDERAQWFESFHPAAISFKERGLRGRFLGNYGNALAECGRLDDAEIILKERLQCAVDQVDQAGEGLAKEHLGKLLLRRGRLAEAYTQLTEAFTIATKLQEEATVTRLLKDMADAAFRREEIDAGVKLLEERLRRCEAAGDSLLVLSTCQVLAERLLDSGRLEQCKPFAAKAATVARQLRFPIQLAAIQGTLGNIALEEQKFDTAKKHFARARRIFRKLGRIVEQGKTASSLGQVAWKMGKHNRAIRWFRAAIEVDKGVGRKNDLAIDLGSLAGVLSEIGDISGAMDCYAERIEILDAIAEHERAAETRLTLARFSAAVGEFEAAISMGEKALQYFSDQANPRSAEIKLLVVQWRNQSARPIAARSNRHELLR